MRPAGEKLVIRLPYLPYSLSPSQTPYRFRSFIPSKYQSRFQQLLAIVVGHLVLARHDEGVHVAAWNKFAEVHVVDID
jgi:hypothetical protein